MTPAAATLLRPCIRSIYTGCCNSSLHASTNALAGLTVGEKIRTCRHFSAAATAAAATAAPAKGAAAEGLLRAGTLLLNNPPPGYEVSVHLGLKVQASLLLQRLPLVYREPQYEQEFRVYREVWEKETQNGPILSDEITYMQLPDHFLETQKQQEEREQQQRKTGDAQLSELDMLLQQQGLKLTRHKHKRQQQQQQQQQGVSADTAGAGAAEREKQSLSQQPERVLLLLVKYGDMWQLPVEDRRPGQSMRQTLARLCMQQLGLGASPFLVGFAPAAVRRMRSNPSEQIQGREVFYYRAYHVPGRPQVAPPPNSPVRDWAWVTAEEAKRRLSPAAFFAIRDALLLG